MKEIKFLKYDFERETIKRNLKDEVRTFHITQKQRPLLSISRILKPLNEHNFLMIKKEYLLPSKIIGKLSHFLIEQTYKQKELIVIKSVNDIEKFLGEGMEKFRNLNSDKQKEIVATVNKIVRTAHSFFEKEQIKVLRSEFYICNTIYHGFIDIIAQDKDGKLMIIELKTSKINKVKYETKLQLGLYKKLVQEHYKEEIITKSLRFDLKNNKVFWDTIEGNEFDKLSEVIEKII